MSKGYIYVLSNPSMPGLVKIGRSKHGGRNRACALYQTGVPTPFAIEFEILADCCEDLEIRIHDFLYNKRENPGREFFRLDTNDAILAVLTIYAEDFEHEFTPYDQTVYLDEVYDYAKAIDPKRMGDEGYGFILSLYSAIRFHLDPEHIREALCRHEAACRERAGKREAARLSAVSNG